MAVEPCAPQSNELTEQLMLCCYKAGPFTKAAFTEELHLHYGSGSSHPVCDPRGQTAALRPALPHIQLGEDHSQAHKSSLKV